MSFRVLLVTLNSFHEFKLDQMHIWNIVNMMRGIHFSRNKKELCSIQSTEWYFSFKIHAMNFSGDVNHADIKVTNHINCLILIRPKLMVGSFLSFNSMLFISFSSFLNNQIDKSFIKFVRCWFRSTMNDFGKMPSDNGLNPVHPVVNVNYKM